MKHTIHVPSDFQHMNKMEKHMKQLKIKQEQLDGSKSFKIDGSDKSLTKFLKYIKKFEGDKVFALSHSPMSKVTTRIASIQPMPEDDPSMFDEVKLDTDSEIKINAAVPTPKTFTYFTARQIAQIYGLTATPTNRVGIAIIELGGGYNPADLANYWNYIGLTTVKPNVISISVDGAQNTPGSSADFEVVLDIEIIGGICPNSNIYVYFAPNTDAGFYDAINAAITSTTNPASIVSISWGAPENNWAPSTLQSFNSLFQTAALAGKTVCVASGDNSSSDGETTGNHVDFPAASPWVLACGGTHLVCPDLNYGSNTTLESVWGSGNATGAGAGGGFSTVFPRPPYQTNATASYSTPGRAVPDVSGDADPSTGWVVYLDGSYYLIGGTSAVAPLWAGLLGSINFKNFANTTLYSLYQTNKTICHDIITGGEGFPATGGWDPASGLGSPNGSVLISLLGNHNTVTVLNPNNQIAYQGNPINLQITATDSAPSNITYAATNLPTGLTVNPNTGLISGVPQVTGNVVVVTATDLTGASGSTSFLWSVIP